MNLRSGKTWKTEIFLEQNVLEASRYYNPILATSTTAITVTFYKIFFLASSSEHPAPGDPIIWMMNDKIFDLRWSVIYQSTDKMLFLFILPSVRSYEGRDGKIIKRKIWPIVIIHRVMLVTNLPRWLKVVDRIFILVTSFESWCPTLTLKDIEFWWRKWSKPTPIS